MAEIMPSAESDSCSLVSKTKDALVSGTNSADFENGESSASKLEEDDDLRPLLTDVIGVAGTGVQIKFPRKRFYRQRAHSNPLSDHDLHYPTSPDQMDWDSVYGDRVKGRVAEFADIGCGYGGLLVRLAPLFPDVCMVGMEIRVKVSNFVQEKIEALRANHPDGRYDNICCLRTNAMKCLPFYFSKGQLSKMFFLYPDPHFKAAKHKWRIISPNLLSEYAFFLRPNGILYTITDVEELHLWMVRHLEAHPLFERLTAQEMADDSVVELLYESTEEGQKVARNAGQRWAAVFRRSDNPPWPPKNAIGYEFPCFSTESFGEKMADDKEKVLHE